MLDGRCQVDVGRVGMLPDVEQHAKRFSSGVQQIFQVFCLTWMQESGAHSDICRSTSPSIHSTSSFSFWRLWSCRFSPDKRISEAANSFNLIPTFRTCMSRSFSRSRSGGCSAGARTNNPVWRPTAQPRTANASIHQIMGCLWADAPRTALTQRDFARLFSRALPTHSRLGPCGACAIR